MKICLMDCQLETEEEGLLYMGTWLPDGSLFSHVLWEDKHLTSIPRL